MSRILVPSFSTQAMPCTSTGVIQASPTLRKYHTELDFRVEVPRKATFFFNWIFHDTCDANELKRRVTAPVCGVRSQIDS